MIRIKKKILTAQHCFTLESSGERKSCRGCPGASFEAPALFTPHPRNLLHPEVISCQSGIVNLQQDTGIVSCQVDDLKGETQVIEKVRWAHGFSGYHRWVVFLYSSLPKIWREVNLNLNFHKLVHTFPLELSVTLIPFWAPAGSVLFLQLPLYSVGFVRVAANLWATHVGSQ